jgi:hypothetical protein
LLTSKIQAKINTLPQPPIVSQVSRCGPGRVQINGSVHEASSSIRWYSADANNRPKATGLIWITPILNRDTLFFAETINRQSRCSSATRIIVPVHINTIPENPIALNDSICGPGIARLSVQQHNRYSTYWYTDALLRNLYSHHSDTIFTPRINILTNYYVILKDTITGCRSPVVRATAYIKSSLPPPAHIDYPSTACRWLGLDTPMLLRCQPVNGAKRYEWKTDNDSLLYLLSSDSFRLNLSQIAVGTRLSVRGTNGCPGLWKTTALCASPIYIRSVVKTMGDATGHFSWVFPNPCREQFMVRLPVHNADRAFIQVFDFSGRNFLTETFSAKRDLRISCAHWPPGIYSIVIQYSGMSFTRKLIKLP